MDEANASFEKQMSDAKASFEKQMSDAKASYNKKLHKCKKELRDVKHDVKLFQMLTMEMIHVTTRTSNKRTLPQINAPLKRRRMDTITP